MRGLRKIGLPKIRAVKQLSVGPDIVSRFQTPGENGCRELCASELRFEVVDRLLEGLPDVLNLVLE